ncbi:conserved hypothetical protein [Frankia canadensis]|uniref:Uncharacterized protein n=1 Tax=Frankia canadensis TaxID=1836972 RepID=A0A2I2KLI6_9ACTN|nr:hypothetical protein [Frankia canadensis]SNQ46529.1 conserved hypothetical protein [Frankia canadensis]SOU53819.1 conserved hypothetical protein [Frankia canadensis]
MSIERPHADIESPPDAPRPARAPDGPTQAELKAQLLDRAAATRTASDRSPEPEARPGERPADDRPSRATDRPTLNPDRSPTALERDRPSERRPAPDADPPLTPLERKLALLDRRDQTAATPEGTEHPYEETPPEGVDAAARARGDGDRLGWRLNRIWKDSQPTTDGRAFYEKNDDKMWWYAHTAEPSPGRYTADLHGSPQGFRVGHHNLDATHLAALIRKDDTWQGRPVRLMSCETGQGDDPIAQKLADELGVSVTAPTELAFSGSDGRVYTTSEYEDEHGNLVQTIPYDGVWLEFEPRQEEDKRGRD